MATPLMSPRLPGVKILAPETTGPQYSRWRREVQSAFSAKGTWGHCDGTQPMPMPRAGPNFFSPSTASTPQPELLEERRTWVKRDRDVKMDLFLSVADEIKVEVFEVGPPLPPSAMTAKEMIEALDERYKRFVFEDYHHVFCHFLNLHIDQFENIGGFNAEFKATLEDLLDFGHALTEVQACSAYLSKLRCTQNPWVATKLKEWDSLPTPPQITDLMSECPPWMVIRPLSLKPSSRMSAPDEDLMGPPSIQEEDEGELSETDRSESATSSTSSGTHSRPPSTQSLKRPVVSFPRRSSSLYSKPDICDTLNSWSQADQAFNTRSSSRQSHEIKVRTSAEDVVTLSAFPLPAKQLPKVQKDRVTRRSSAPGLPKSTLPPINRPLPPIPSESPTPASTPSPLSRPGCQNDASYAVVSETHTTHNTPVDSQPRILKRPTSSHTLFPPINTTPPSDLRHRPSSSRSSVPSTLHSPKSPTPSSDAATRTSKSSSSWILPARSMPLLNRHSSNDSSIIGLPLQGTDAKKHTSKPSNPAQNSRRASHSASYFGTSPPRSLMSRLSAELNDDFDKRIKKRSWSLRARLSNRVEVKEII